MRKRIRDYKRVWRVGDVYIQSSNVVIKSLNETKGIYVPTNATYDSYKKVESKDILARAVLSNGMIHYLPQGTYIIK